MCTFFATPTNTIGMSEPNPVDSKVPNIPPIQIKKKKLKPLKKYLKESLEAKPLYACVELDDKSKNELLEFAKAQDFNAKRYLCHHMTIAFGDDISKVQDFLDKNIGKNVELVAYEFGKSDKAMAVKVSTPVKSLNKIKHITLAVSNSGKSVDSNFIKEWTSIMDQIFLNGTIKYIYK